MHYQIINLETGEFEVVTLEQAAEIAALDPADIEWAIEEEGVCETDTYQITKLDEAAEPLPVFVFLSRDEFEARLLETGSTIQPLTWRDSLVHDAVEADLRTVATALCPDDNAPSEPSQVYRLSGSQGDAIALIR
jgi:hypothetical protein